MTYLVAIARKDLTQRDEASLAQRLNGERVSYALNEREEISVIFGQPSRECNLIYYEVKSLYNEHVTCKAIRAIVKCPVFFIHKVIVDGNASSNNYRVLSETQKTGSKSAASCLA